MGSDYAAGMVTTISEEDLMKILPQQLQQFNDVKQKCIQDILLDFEGLIKGVSFNEIFEESWKSSSGDFPEDILNKYMEEYLKAFNELADAFANLTSTGELELDLFYVDPDLGSEYDEVEGIIWVINNAYVKSPAACELEKMYNIEIDLSYYCQYG